MRVAPTVGARPRTKRLQPSLAPFVQLANLLERRHLDGTRLPRPWEPEDLDRNVPLMHEIYMEAAKLLPSRHGVAAARRRAALNVGVLKATMESVILRGVGPGKIGPRRVIKTAEGALCIRIEGPFVALPGYPEDAPPLLVDDVYRVAHTTWQILRALAALAWIRKHPSPAMVRSPETEFSPLPAAVLVIDDEGRIRRVADPALELLGGLLNGVEADRIRHCVSCQMLFFADRKDKPACSETCLATNRQRKWRVKRDRRKLKADYPDQFEFAAPKAASGLHAPKE